MIKIICWSMLIGGVLAFLTPMIAEVMMYFYEKKVDKEK